MFFSIGGGARGLVKSRTSALLGEALGGRKLGVSWLDTRISRKKKFQQLSCDREKLIIGVNSFVQ